MIRDTKGIRSKVNEKIHKIELKVENLLVFFFSKIYWQNCNKTIKETFLWNWKSAGWPLLERTNIIAFATIFKKNDKDINLWKNYMFILFKFFLSFFYYSSEENELAICLGNGFYLEAMLCLFNLE